MATTIQIKRSANVAAPTISDLVEGELAYSEDQSGNGAGAKLYIESLDSGLNPVIHTIGGKYYTTLIDAATNSNTASTLVKRDASGNFSANVITATTFVGNISGAVTSAAIANTANALTTARDIGLAGDLTGNVSFDGSQNVTLTATIAANSVALGTDTTGNYLANVIPGNGLTGSGFGTEGATPTLTLAASGVSATTYGGTTQIPVLTVDTYGRVTSASNVTLTSGVSSVNGRTGAVTGLAETANGLSQFASTTSSQLAGIISDETGSGSLVFATAPTLVTPVLGLATGTSVMLSANIGAAAGNVSGNFTAGNFQTAGNVNAASALYTGALTAGTLQTTGNTNMAAGLATGNFTAGNLQTAGNVNAGSLLVTNGATLSGNVNITGNLNVTGAVTTYTSNTVEIADTILYIGTGNSGDVQDLGLVGHFTNPTYQHTGLVRDASDGVWKLFANVQTEPSNNTLDFSTATYSPLTMGALTASTGTFSGTVSATSSNVNSQNELVSGSLTAGTIQTAGNVNANNLRVVTNSSLGTVVQGTWNGSSISTTYTDAKVVSVNGRNGTVTGLAETANSLSQFASTTSAQLATLISDETGSGALVFGTSPVLTTPNIGTPSYAVLTSATGLPVSTGISGLGSGVATFLATPTSANFATIISDETGTGNILFSNSPVMVTPNLGTPSSVTLTNATGLPISTGVSGLGTNVANFLGYPTSANLISVVSDETGSGSLVFATAPTLVTPVLGLATGTSVMLSANIGAAAGNVSGNFTAGNFQSSGNVNVASGLFTGSLTAGTLQSAGNINVAAGLVTGNFTAGNFQTASNVNSQNELVNGSLTAGTIQTSGNVNANNLRVVTNSSLGTVVQGTWQGSSISTTYTDAKVTSIAGTTNQITASSSTGAITLSLPNDVTVNNNLTVTGNLFVLGDAVTMNTATLSVEDPLVKFGNANPSDAMDIGFFGEYVSSGTKWAGLFRDASDSGKFKLFTALTVNPTSNVVDTSSYTVATLVSNITGGTVSGLSANIAVSDGGTGRGTLTNNAVLYGLGTSAVGLATGTAGQVLQLNASGVPTFAGLDGGTY